ncbi:nuclear transport factor 2 family protein [Sphingosinicella xenopeptidilytica]|uniref:Nuclear transport factor 2 family protein n=1 Tax=Sphingosinicella xenopeptidilytica TaxID=364098 RepID=A0ABW3C472_SPHXN
MIARHARQLREALLTADRAVLDRLVSDSLIFFHLGGTQDNKAGFVSAGDRMRLQKIEVSDQEIAIYGEAAVVTSEERVEATLVGKEAPISLHARLMTVWAKEDGRWRLTRYQPTPILPFKPTATG